MSAHWAIAPSRRVAGKISIFAVRWRRSRLTLVRFPMTSSVGSLARDANDPQDAFAAHARRSDRRDDWQFHVWNVASVPFWGTSQCGTFLR